VKVFLPPFVAPSFSRVNFRNWAALSLVAALAVPGLQASDGTWTAISSGTASGTWSDALTGNWAGGVVAGGSGSIANFATLNISGTSTVTLGEPRTIGGLIFGDTTVGSAGSWVLAGSGANVLTLQGGSPTITVNALGTGATATISANIAGSNGVTKDGAGILTLSGSNTFTGGLNITAGELRVVGNTNAVANATLGAAGGSVSLSNGAILRSLSDGTFAVGTGRTLTVGTGGGILAASGFSPRNFDFTIEGSGLVSLAAGTTNIRLNGTNTNTGGFHITSGGVEFQSAGALPSTGSILIGASGGLISVAGSGAFTSPQAWLSSGRIDTASTGAILLTGTTNNQNVDFTGYDSLFLGVSGLVNLGGPNLVSYSGTITPAGSTYRLGHNAGSNALTLQLNQTNQLTGARNLVVGNGTAFGAVWLSAANDYSAGTSVSSTGRLIISNGGALGGGAVTVAAGGELRLRDGITVGNALSLSGAPSDSTLGTLHSLTGNNVYNGNVSLASGARIAASNTSGNSLVINGNIALGSNSLSFLAGSSGAYAGGDISVTGTLSGSGGITKTNSTGLLTFSGNNTTYSGTVTNSGGMIAVGSDTALGTGALILNGNAGIQSANSATRTLANAFGSFAGTNATYSFGAASGPGTGNLIFSNVSTASLGSAVVRTFQVNNTTTFEGGFSGAGSGITKTGSGTMVMNGVSSYTGATTVNAGTLLVNGSLNSASAVSVGTAGTLGGGGAVGGNTTIGGILAPGSSTESLAFGGNLTLLGTANTVMEIVGTNRGAGVNGYDAIDLTNAAGLLTYDGTLTLTMTSLIANDTYDLFAFITSAAGSFDSIVFAGGAYSGTFSQEGSVWTATSDQGQVFSFDQTTGDLTVVPEPAVSALVGLSLMSVLFLRRRQGRA
jgi:fibronectin-binding autotransporter adhesin